MPSQTKTVRQIVALLFGARLALFRDTVWPMLLHPVQSMFLGAIPMGLAVLIKGLLLFGVPRWGEGVYALAHALWWLDAALAQLAEASKLALEEAAARAQTFSSEDLARARNDLESLEAMFLETLQTSASGAKDATGEILSDLARHARLYGSAVRAQLKETLAVITHQLGTAGRTQVVAGLHLAQATSDLLRQIAAGVLTGLADHVKPGHPKGNGD